MLGVLLIGQTVASVLEGLTNSLPGCCKGLNEFLMNLGVSRICVHVHRVCIRICVLRIRIHVCICTYVCVMHVHVRKLYICASNIAL